MMSRIGPVPAGLEVTMTGQRLTRQLPGGLSHGLDEELGRVSEISNMFDTLPTRPP